LRAGSITEEKPSVCPRGRPWLEAQRLVDQLIVFAFFIGAARRSTPLIPLGFFLLCCGLWIICASGAAFALALADWPTDREGI
jgi:hypothetical protein